MTSDEERKLAEKLAPPIGWWHNLPNSWLIVDHSDRLTTSDIRQIVQDINPDRHSLVIEATVTDWASRNNAQTLQTVQWLRENWL